MVSFAIPRAQQSGVRRPEWPFSLNRQSPQAQGLIGFWPLVGTAADLATVGYGEVVNGGEWVGSTLGAQSLNLTAASTQYVSVPTSRLLGDFTASFWVKRNADRGLDAGISKSNSAEPAPFDIYWNGGAWQYYVGDGIGGYTFIAATSIAGPGVWEQVTVTCVGANSAPMEIYLQGVLRNTGNTFRFNDLGNAIQFGSRGDLFTALDGQIAHVALWNRVLSPTEIWALYDPATRWDLYKPISPIHVPGLTGRGVTVAW